MGVYYAVFALVCALGLMSQACDRRASRVPCWGRVWHTPLALTFYLLAAAVLISVAGLRYRVGADFGAYYGTYSDVDDLMERFLTVDEPGFYLLAFIATRLFGAPVAVTFLAAAVTVGGMLFTLYRGSDRLLLGLALFFLICWHGCFNGVRQYLAVAAVFAGYPFLRDRRLIPYLACVGVAFLFHRSSLVMACVYPACHMEITKRNLAVLTVAAVAVLFSFERVLGFTGWLLNVGEGGYTDAYITNSVNPLRIVAGIAPATAGLAWWWNRPKGERETFYLNLLSVHALVTLASAGSAYIARIAVFTSPFLMMAIPQLLKPLPRRYRTSVTTAAVLCYAFFWWWEVSNSGSLNHWQWVPELGL